MDWATGADDFLMKISLLLCDVALFLPQLTYILTLLSGGPHNQQLRSSAHWRHAGRQRRFFVLLCFVKL